jgi:hypothetical protein
MQPHRFGPTDVSASFRCAKNIQVRTAARIIRLLDIVMSRAPEEMVSHRSRKTTMHGLSSIPLCQPKRGTRNKATLERRLGCSILY